MASSSRKLLLQRLSLSGPAPLLALLFLSTTTTVLQASGTTSNTSSSAYYGASSSSRGGAASSAADAAGRGGSSWSLQQASTSGVFSLDRYGARGDGKHDDTPALVRAWKAACSSSSSSSRPVVLVPRGKRYLLKPVSLAGPCKSGVVTVAVRGTLVASPNRADWSDENRMHWIVFRGVSKLTVNGGGAVDGNGHTWWQHSCKINKALPCKEAPTALSFYYCTNLRVEDLKIVNSQQIHMSVEDCANVRLTRLSITAPGTSPNTDGIHVTRSKDVHVTNCKIMTGDDCMSIENGTRNLRVSKVVCGPGHGISIGSLGDDNSRAEVSGIHVDTVQFRGTTNGARIKTYQGGSGYAKDITFQNIIMDSVKNPIIVDQNYCDQATPCRAQGSAVEVSNVVFKNIRGTTVTKEAIKLNCSRTVPCHDITLQNIDLKMEGGLMGAAESICQNAKWRKSGTVLPLPCTSKN